jgi:hypothetical protein
VTLGMVTFSDHEPITDAAMGRSQNIVSPGRSVYLER